MPTSPQLQLAIKFAFQLGETIKDVARSEEIGLQEILLFMPVLASAAPAFSDPQALKGELLAIDKDSAAELSNFIENEFDIEDDNLEQYLEELIELAMQIYAFVNAYHISKTRPRRTQ